MNKLFVVILFASLIFTQNQDKPNVLHQIQERTKLINKKSNPELEIDGEMQADTAIDGMKLSEVYPFTHLSGPANVLVFSRLSAANVAYKLLDELGGADAIGPVLLGMDKPVHILQRGCAVQDILNLSTIASVDWQARNKHI